MFSSTRKTGFTLVEILIVVVILGILAAIVIPQFTNASEEARSNSLITQLQSIRSQLELYQVQHNGDYPTLAQLQADWDVMVNKTDADGVVVATGDFGPYLQQPPKNAFQDNSITVLASGGTFAAGDGWSYDEATGAIMAIVSAAKAADVGLDTATNDIVTY